MECQNAEEIDNVKQQSLVMSLVNLTGYDQKQKLKSGLTVSGGGRKFHELRAGGANTNRESLASNRVRASLPRLLRYVEGSLGELDLGGDFLAAFEDGLAADAHLLGDFTFAVAFGQRFED